MRETVHHLINVFEDPLIHIIVHNMLVILRVSCLQTTLFYPDGINLD